MNLYSAYRLRKPNTLVHLRLFTAHEVPQRPHGT